MSIEGDRSGAGSEDACIAEFFALLGQVLAKPASKDLMSHLANLQVERGTSLGDALADLADAARQAELEEIEDEYSRLFVGLGRGELLPYGSYYLTGFLNGKPLVALRQHMARLGIAPAAENVEPEDHIAALCEIMAGLLTRRFSDGCVMEARSFFAEHMEPWAPKFFSDLETASSVPFYGAVGRLGRAFVEIQSEAARLA